VERASRNKIAGARKCNDKRDYEGLASKGRGDAERSLNDESTPHTKNKRRPKMASFHENETMNGL
jgi:hypothetical protein